MKGLILSGGHGTRLRPLTYSQQKQLIPIANKPILFYAIEDLLDAGIHEIAIVVGPNADQVKETVQGYDWAKWGDPSFTFVHQDQPKGLAHAVLVAADFLGRDPFVMYLGDNLLKGGIKSHVERFLASEEEARILLTKVPDPTKFGVAELAEDGSIVCLEEKPAVPKSDLALVGIYLFRSSIIEASNVIQPSQRGELEITHAIQKLIDDGQAVHSSLVEGWWKDTGLAADMLDANALVLDDLKPENQAAEVSDKAILKGRITLGRGSRILGRTTIKGPVLIGANCTIEDSFIGPYTTIGPDSTLLRAEIEDSIVLEGSRLESCGRLVESLLGRGVTVMSNTSTPRGHRIVVGDNSEIRL